MQQYQCGVARRLIALLPFVVLAAMAASCRSPTEIDLDIHTNVPCTDRAHWQGVAVYLGEPGVELEAKAPTLVATECDSAGQVGSLVVVPSAGKGDLVGVRVVAGVDRNPEDCLAVGYAGCIVSRRTVRFTPHGSLALDIALEEDCIGQACDPEHTCLSGRCVDARTAEAPVETPVPVAPSVRCGDNGVRCATSGDVCCLSVNTELRTTSGDCRPAESCPTTSITLYCDDDSDCASLDDADAGAALCVLSYDRDKTTNHYFEPTHVSLAECLPATSPLPSDVNVGLALCEDRQPCAGRFPCIASWPAAENPTPNQLPGYHWCELMRP